MASNISDFKATYEQGVALRVGMFVHRLEQIYSDQQAGRPLSQSTGTIDRGKWSDAFLEVPLVLMAEREGWGRHLRMYVYNRVRAQATGEPDRPFLDPRAYMPKDQKWIRGCQRQAIKDREDQAWLMANVKGHESIASRIIEEASE